MVFFTDNDEIMEILNTAIQQKSDVDGTENKGNETTAEFVVGDNVNEFQLLESETEQNDLQDENQLEGELETSTEQ